MLLNARPLYDNQADRQFFIHRPEWNRLFRAIERNLNTIVIGSRGCGKTSLLHQVQLACREHGEEVAFVDGTGAATALDLAARIRQAAAGRRSALAANAGAALDVLTSSETEPGGPSRALASELRGIGEAPPQLIIVDGPSAPEATFGLFGRMRDVLWQQNHRWLVAIDSRDRGSVLKPPADAFFDVAITLEKWSVNQLIELLGRRSEGEISDALLTAAATSAEGNPREALRAVSYCMVNDEDPRTILNARGRLLERASELGRPAAMLMAELLGREQASPSDADLQDALGVTRSRLTQLFRRLAAEELVLAEDERPSGPGRPRTIYRPNLPG